MKKVRRLEPLPETKRQLFLLSRNKCAFPSCEQLMIDQYGHFIGHICHIEAANMGGERFNSSQTNEQRRSISNLVLMCPTHHGVTNNVEQYSVIKMQEIKATHESKAYTEYWSDAGAANLFVDITFSNVVSLLSNVDELSLSAYGLTSIGIIETVNDFIKIMSRVPRANRIIFAHCLISSSGDYYLEFDPREIAMRLGINDNTFIDYSVILKRMNFLSEVDSDNYPNKLSQYIKSPTGDENHIWFLMMIRDRFYSEPSKLLDVFENLNFVHLEL